MASGLALLLAVPSLVVPPPFVPAVPTADAPLTLVEHTMPLMPPGEYEPQLRLDLEGQGDIVRWYVARVDEPSQTVVAEVLLLSGAAASPGVEPDT